MPYIVYITRYTINSLLLFVNNNSFLSDSDSPGIYILTNLHTPLYLV